MQQVKAHNIMDADKGASNRLIAAVILQAVSDLKLPATHPHHKSSVEFFWGRSSVMSNAYLSLLNYNPEQFKAKLKAQLEAVPA